MYENALNEINAIIRSEFQKKAKILEEQEPGISLMEIPFDELEVMEAIESLISTNLTMGDKVLQFESDWSEYINRNHTIMVNSGSSANLIALKTLTNRSIDNPILRDSEIITPALTWSTTLFPILDIQAKPVLIDVSSDSFLIDLEDLKEAITPNTSAIMPVHLLGNPLDMNAIMEIAEDHNLWVIEDACEAHGAKIGDNKVGSFGHISTFSFFFSHHITTIEGGTLSTNDENLANISRSLRAHGWIRERSDKEKYVSDYKTIDPRFLFVTNGYNLRPTELQAAFGIHQIMKLDSFVEIRKKNHNYLLNELTNYDQFLSFLHERPNFQPSYFGFPMTVKPNSKFTVHELKDVLEQNNIQTRPIMGGNIARHPAVLPEDVKIYKTLENADFIMDNGLFIGNHQNVREIDLKHFVKIIRNFIDGKI